MSMTLMMAAMVAVTPSQLASETTAYVRDGAAIALPLSLSANQGTHFCTRLGDDADTTLEMPPGMIQAVSLGMVQGTENAGAPIALESAPAEAEFGAEDSWRWNLWGSYGDDFNDSHEVRLGVGLSWFFIRGLSLDLELNGMYFDQPRDDAVGGNFNLLVRWHFLMRETWSLYADLGAGLLVTSDEVPHDGSEVNFTPQAGVGASFEVADNVRMLTGIRWHHISNANLYDENPGQDTVMAYAGFSFPF